MKLDYKYPDGDRPTLFEEALKFQDFVTDLLLKELGLVVSAYSSRYYQYNFGESRQGIEIKLDMRMSDTGNISIEVAEKSRASIEHWTPSGIMRDDNTWLYIQGNYNTIYIFGKKFLRQLYEARYINSVRDAKSTLRAFLMPRTEADKYCLRRIDIEKSVKYVV